MVNRQSPSDYVEQAHYNKKVKEAPYLKGLLKPFKDKGEYEILEQQASAAREGIAAMMNEISDIWAKPPLSLLGVHMGVQPSSSGATHLRWRTRGRGQRMGVGVWSNAMTDMKMSEEMLDELHLLEILRLQTNMQMSCLQFIMKQARECQEKVDEAADILSQSKAMRLQQAQACGDPGEENKD